MSDPDRSLEKVEVDISLERNRRVLNYLLGTGTILVSITTPQGHKVWVEPEREGGNGLVITYPGGMDISGSRLLYIRDTFLILHHDRLSVVGGKLDERPMTPNFLDEIFQVVESAGIGPKKNYCGVGYHHHISEHNSHTRGRRFSLQILNLDSEEGKEALLHGAYEKSRIIPRPDPAEIVTAFLDNRLTEAPVVLDGKVV